MLTIKKMKKITILTLIITIIFNFFFMLNKINSSATVRLKDVSKIVEVRENQIYGFGLVMGLQNSGDSKAMLFTNKALTNLLKKMGIPQDGREYTSRNIAAVMVTATLPPFIKKGQKIDVIVSSIGDANSLAGGTLLLTPLEGPDKKIYALAQGAIIVGGLAEASTYSRMIKNQATVGRIQGGGIVEEEVPVTLSDNKNITIALNKPNFITASRVEQALIKAGFTNAMAIDASTITVPLANASLVNTIAKIESVSLTPDASNKVVINAKTGTVAIGEMVRLSPVAITHGNISIKILDEKEYNDYFGYYDPVRERNPITITESKAKFIYLKPDDNLSSLVNALNKVGTTPRDMISILQALKESGSLIGDIEII